MNSKRRRILILFGILLLGFLLRTYGLNWDQGFHLHPDERAIVLFEQPLHFPTSFQSFFSPSSAWNPHFFAYGSFPTYLLWIAGHLLTIIFTTSTSYDSINLIGRVLSALFDTGTIFCLYLLGRRLFSQTAGFLSALLYAMCVLPIQLSHFYAVDTLLTFLSTLTLLLLILFYEKPGIKKACGVGISVGLALATKISALPLLLPLFFTLTNEFILVFLKEPHRPHHYLPLARKTIRHLLTWGTSIVVIAIVTFVVVEPYAVIDRSTFLLQNQQQSVMTKDAWIFPYTLQYVGKIPYLYELKNLFLWGMGPYLALLSFGGLIFIINSLYRRKKTEKWAGEVILLSFLFPYFLIVGHFAVGFMRYMLPLYPLFCLFGSALLAYCFTRVSKNTMITCCLAVFLAVGFWTVSFLHIYTQPNTRVQATSWIETHIPYGSTIAIEHWDDGLPLSGSSNYHIVTLPLYDPDTSHKWAAINKTLQTTDYIIVASNRLYVPLLKLTNCPALAPHPCYQTTATYYKSLFSGKRGFTKVATFAEYPQVPFLHLSINDESADESFTVYDHPKVIIFKRTQSRL